MNNLFPGITVTGDAVVVAGNDVIITKKEKIVCPTCKDQATIEWFDFSEGGARAWCCNRCKLILKVIVDE